MIWKDPVHKNRTIREWISGAGFPDGTEEAVTEAVKVMKNQDPTSLLNGKLVVVSAARRNVTWRYLATLRSFADTVDYCLAYQVPDLIRQNDIHEDSGLPIRDLLATTDLLIVDQFTNVIRDWGIREIIRAIGPRVLPPPKVTIVIGDMAFIETSLASLILQFQDSGGRVKRWRDE